MAIQPPAFMAPIIGIANQVDQWITNATTINFSTKNGRLIVENAATNQTRELRTQCYLVAVIMNVFASLFPSCCYGTSEISVQGRIYYVPRSEIKNVFACNENLPCNFESSKKNAEDLEIIALQYFTKKAFNAKTFANLVHQGVQMLGGIQNLAALAQGLQGGVAPVVIQGAAADPAAGGAIPAFWGAQAAMAEAFGLPRAQ